ncbi:MAG TPA: glycoside hydrolase family 3 N-terminal domain-containing protein [Humibacter sp.]|nr:glycoside hydrolase family 3 N-terminal domain-containing protein [Humibacter sp.]
MRHPQRIGTHRGGAVRAAVVVVALALIVAGCTRASPVHGSSASAVPTHTSPASPTPSPTPTPRPDPLAALTLEQRVGQLFMVGTPARYADAGTLSAITDLHVGNVFLSGRSYQGVAATRSIVDQFIDRVGAASTAGIGLFVATDQEGGEVQVLQGPGFDRMPSALEQGRMSPAVLQTQAARWGSQLASAHLSMNLGPVSDLVASPAAAADNPPIGGFDRQFGYTLTGVVQHADAFRAGMNTTGIVPVIKHFPGLGAVTENTDDTAGVTDTVTTQTSASVRAFQSQIDSGVQCIMVSSAVYAKIDPKAPAVFSKVVLQSLLRDRLGFDGVVMTDDLSAATQVEAWSPADRAIDAISAGADIVLVSAAPWLAQQMVDAVVQKARHDRSFAASVDAAARRVLALKGRT